MAKSTYYFMKVRLLYVCCCIAISACKYTCPRYDGDDKSIISFSRSDTITYISNANDTIKLLVFNTYFEKENSWRGLSMDIDCRPQAYYEALDNKTNIYIKEQHDWQLTVFFCEDTPYRGITFDKENDLKCVNTTNKKVGEKIYQFVWEIEDLSAQRRIDRFIKTDFHGILEFHDKKTNLTWTQLIE